MKNIFTFCAVLVGFASITFAQQTLVDVINPYQYKARAKPEINVLLVDYGKEQTPDQLNQIKTLLENRFYLATNKMLKLKVVISASLPYQHKIENYPNYSLPNVTGKDRLQRLWYYDHVNANILSEIYNNVKKNTPAATLKNIDVIASVTGAQFDGLGFAYGRVGVTESPREIAWGLPDGGYTQKVSIGAIVDELIHEVGHTLFMDHASSQCQAASMSYAEQQACCEKSPAKNDVMSYCRNRAAVNDTDVFYGFSACNLRNLKNKIVPAILSGGAWNVPNREKCL